MRETDKDYYYMIINKPTGKVHLNSLKGIRVLIPNPSNPPFQCRWNDNAKPVQRTYEEAKSYILSVLSQTFCKRAEDYKTFKRAV